MSDVYGIGDALLVGSISQDSIAESFYGRQHIKFLAHLIEREIAISPSFLQRTHHSPVVAVLPYRHIVVKREPPVGNEFLHRPRLQQHVKQIGKPSPVQSARSSSKSQLPRLGIGIHHLLVGLRHSMMGLVNYDERRFLLQFMIMLRQPLNRENTRGK